MRNVNAIRTGIKLPWKKERENRQSDIKDKATEAGIMCRLSRMA